MNTQFRLGRIHTAILAKLHSMEEHEYTIWIVNVHEIIYFSMKWRFSIKLKWNIKAKVDISKNAI